MLRPVSSNCCSISERDEGKHYRIPCLTPSGSDPERLSEEELEELFEPYFRIEELKTVLVKGKPGDHRAVYAFMQRR